MMTDIGTLLMRMIAGTCWTFDSMESGKDCAPAHKASGIAYQAPGAHGASAAAMHVQRHLISAVIGLAVEARDDEAGRHF